MAKYRAYATYSVELVMDLEADNMEQAQEIARNADGADFHELVAGDWYVDEVVEVV